MCQLRCLGGAGVCGLAAGQPLACSAMHESTRYSSAPHPIQQCPSRDRTRHVPLLQEGAWGWQCCWCDADAQMPAEAVPLGHCFAESLGSAVCCLEPTASSQQLLCAKASMRSVPFCERPVCADAGLCKKRLLFHFWRAPMMCTCMCSTLPAKHVCLAVSGLQMPHL